MVYDCNNYSSSKIHCNIFNLQKIGELFIVKEKYMETYTITKAQLLEYYNEISFKKDKKEEDGKVKLPNANVNVRVPKSGVLNFVQTGNDQEGWLKIVSANRPTKKILKLNQDQFAVLLLNLMAQKTVEKDESL
jgi:hypothetical protein